MRYTLENDFLKVTADTAGAELVSIVSKADGTEYMWQADEKYWKRHAPVLFPIVGNARGKELHIGGASYPMGQHGFARDMEFSLASRTEDSLLFCLESDDETRGRYPYDFRLQIGYALDGAKVTTSWEVINTGSGDMHYQIGGHPAFNCPFGDPESPYYFLFDNTELIRYGLLNSEGLLEDTQYTLNTEDGFYEIAADMFDKDALIIEDGQSRAVSICRQDKTVILTVIFDAPLYGLWSPAGKHAPFVCIEPWFGRADRASFDGDISEREYDQALAPGESRQYSYTVIIRS